MSVEDGALSLSADGLTRQTVTLSGADDPNSYAIYGQDVTIATSRVADSASGSNKVKVNNMVAYDWGTKLYKGQLVASNKKQTYVAYAIKTRAGGIVRLIHCKLAERALIKCYGPSVVDIAFSHSEIDILGSIDETGMLFIHRIDLDTASHIVASIIMQLSWVPENLNMRVIWCPYTQADHDDEDEEDDDRAMLLATVIDSKVYYLNVTQLDNEHGAGPHIYQDVAGSVVEITKHTENVVTASFAPDGTAIAVASEDGTTGFYSVDMDNMGTPRCLYEWQPHGGRPVSLLVFLENLLDPPADVQFWKYAVTGTDNNTELKVWSCEKWQCLQTIRFEAPLGGRTPCLIGNLDLSGHYLVMSDISHRVLYILRLRQDDSCSIAHVCSISEFILGAPCLSFAIMDIRKKQLFNISDSEDDEDEDGDGEEDEQSYRRGLFVHLIGVQPKHLQDMQITFMPLTSADTNSLQTYTGTNSDSFVQTIHDELSDLSLSMATSATPTQSLATPPQSLILPSVQANGAMEARALSQSPSLTDDMIHNTEAILASETPTSSVGTAPAPASSTSSVLLTPDAFTSSPKMQAQLDSLISPASGRSSLTHVTHLHDNSSLGIAESAFAGGSASSVSPRTLTPKSPTSPGMGRKSGAGLASPLLPSTAISHKAESDVETPGQSKKSGDDIERQLDELFSNHACTNQGPTSADISMLIEAGLLNANEFKETVASSGEPNVTIERIAPGSSGASYDTKIWPKPPEPPTEELDREDTGDTDESGSADDSDDDASLSEKVLSDEEELNVTEIERDVEEGEAEEPTQVTKQETPVTAAAAAVTVSPSLQSIPTPLPHQHPQPVPTTLILQDKFTTHLEDMKASILTLNEMMMSQGRDIHQLKSTEGSNQKLDKLAKQISTLNSSMATKLDHSVNSLKREQKLMQDRLISQTTARLTQELRTLVDKSVSAEIKKSVIPALQQMIDPVKKDLHRVMAEKLTAADVSFKDGISRLVSSQTTIDKIAKSVGLAVHDTMHTAHKDSLAQQVLPSFDASVRQAFLQLDKTFVEGLNNYMSQLNENMDQVRSRSMNTHTIMTESCESAVESLRQATADIQNHVSNAVRKEIHNQVALAMGSVKTQIVNEVQSTVKDEITSALENHQRAINNQFEVMRSSAPTPAPDAQPNTALIKVNIDSFLSMKDYEKAFQSALSASDLSVVIYLLKKIPDSSVVMSEPCPLSQPTLLSLMQQLSCGLSGGKHLDLLFDYLADAVYNLDTHDSVTMQHVGVIGSTREKLSEFITKNPSSPHRRLVGTIEKSIRSVLKDVKV